MLSSEFTKTVLDIARFENRVFLYVALAIAALALLLLIGSTAGILSGKAKTNRISK